MPGLPTERTDKVLKLARLVQIVAVEGQTIISALESSLPDFEDAIQHFAAARVADVTGPLTRDPKASPPVPFPGFSRLRRCSLFPSHRFSV